MKRATLDLRSHSICVRRGFTLIEVLLVVAVVVALASVSFSSYWNFGESQRLPRMADDCRGLLTGLRVRAMDEGRTYQFAYKPETGDYIVRTPVRDPNAIERSEPIIGPMRSDSPDLLGPHRMEDGMVFLTPFESDSPTDIEPMISDLAEAGWIVHQFEPDGTADDFTFGIAEPDGHAILAHFAGRTGRVTVEGPILLNRSNTSPAMGGSP